MNAQEIISEKVFNLLLIDCKSNDKISYYRIHSADVIGNNGVGLIVIGKDEVGTYGGRVLSTFLESEFTSLSVNSSHVSRLPNPKNDFVKNHKVIFDQDVLFSEKVLEILNLKENGAVTIVLEPKAYYKGAQYVKKIIDKFKYKIYFKACIRDKHKVLAGKSICAITFMDSGFSIPIFNKNMIRGIGIQYKIVDESFNSGLTFSVIANDFKENLLVVDGVELRIERKEETGLMSCIKTLNEDLASGKGICKTCAE